MEKRSIFVGNIHTILWGENRWKKGQTFHLGIYDAANDAYAYLKKKSRERKGVKGGDRTVRLPASCKRPRHTNRYMKEEI